MKRHLLVAGVWDGISGVQYVPLKLQFILDDYLTARENRPMSVAVYMINTHLVNLGQASTVSHLLKKRGKRNTE